MASGQRKRTRQAHLGASLTGGSGSLSLHETTLAQEMQELRESGVLSSAQRSREFVIQAELTAKAKRGKGRKPATAGRCFTLAGRRDPGGLRQRATNPTPTPCLTSSDTRPLSTDYDLNNNILIMSPAAQNTSGHVGSLAP